MAWQSVTRRSHRTLRRIARSASYSCSASTPVSASTRHYAAAQTSNLSIFRKLTDGSLQVFAHSCPELERLSMSRCTLSAYDSLQRKQTLPINSPAVIHLVASCPRLRCVTLWHAVKFSPIDRSAVLERLRARADTLGGVAILRT